MKNLYLISMLTILIFLLDCFNKKTVLFDFDADIQSSVIEYMDALFYSPEIELKVSHVITGIDSSLSGKYLIALTDTLCSGPKCSFIVNVNKVDKRIVIMDAGLTIIHEQRQEK